MSASLQYASILHIKPMSFFVGVRIMHLISNAVRCRCRCRLYFELIIGINGSLLSTKEGCDDEYQWHTHGTSLVRKQALQCNRYSVCSLKAWQHLYFDHSLIRTVTSVVCLDMVSCAEQETDPTERSKKLSAAKARTAMQLQFFPLLNELCITPTWCELAGRIHLPLLHRAVCREDT